MRMRKGAFAAFSAAAVVMAMRVICGDWVTALEGAFLLFWVGVGIADIYIRMGTEMRQNGKKRR